VATSVEIPFSAEAKRVFRHAAAEADRVDHDNIDVEHLLLGILHEEECIAASVLAAKGMCLDTGREAVMRARNERQDERTG
jgi:ATP-dependent Clp protease ATP-binding subunit ClpC